MQLEYTNIKSHSFVNYTCLFVFSCQADESSDSSEDERGDNNAEKKSHYGKKTTVQCEQWLAFIIPTPTSCSNLDDKTVRPTLIECVRFRGRERRINIPQEIGIKCHEFGLFLLEDDTGARIHSLAFKHMNDAEQINVEVLQQWINGRGKHPVTWKTLTQVLRDLELSRLAGEIEAVKGHTGIPNEDPIGKDLQDIPAEESEEKSTEHTPASGAENEIQCKTLDEPQVDIDLFAADLLDRYYDKSTSHGFSEESSKNLMNITAESSKDSDLGSSGDTPACGVQTDRFYEAMQQMTEIASKLPSKCSELLEAFQKSINLHYPSVQRCQDMIAEVSVVSEQGHIPTNSIQQILNVTADLLSRCFELEAMNLEREENQRCNVASDGQNDMTVEGPEHRNAHIFAGDIEHALKEITDVAADLLSRCSELLDLEALNKESKRNSVSNSVSDDSPVLRALVTKVVKVSEQGSIGNVPTSDTDFTEDAKCHEALQHIADLAADLLYRCFVLLDNVPHEIGDRQLSSQMRS